LELYTRTLLRCMDPWTLNLVRCTNPEAPHYAIFSHPFGLKYLPQTSGYVVLPMHGQQAG